MNDNIGLVLVGVGVVISVLDLVRSVFRGAERDALVRTVLWVGIAVLIFLFLLLR